MPQKVHLWRLSLSKPFQFLRKINEVFQFKLYVPFPVILLKIKNFEWAFMIIFDKLIGEVRPYQEEEMS